MQKYNMQAIKYCRVFPPWIPLVPRQLGKEKGVLSMYGDQVPINLREARKYIGIT